MLITCPVCGESFEVKEGTSAAICPNCKAPLRIVLLEDGTPLVEIDVDSNIEGWGVSEGEILEFEEEELEELWGDIEEA